MPNKKGPPRITLEASKKLCRVIGKNVLKGGNLQVNLHDGSNMLCDKPLKVNDTIIVSLPERKLKDIISFEIGKQAIIMSGRHRGEKGKITEIVSGTSTRKSLTTIDEMQTLTDYAFILEATK